MEDHNCPPNRCAGTVRVRRLDFEQFKACLGSKLVKKGFSWNENDEMWVTLPSGGKGDPLNGVFEVVDQIVKELNRIRHERGSTWPLNPRGKRATWGFRIHGDLICQRDSPRACLGRIEMV